MNNNIEYNSYLKFWETNLQSIEKTTKSLENILLKYETKAVSLNTIYKSIEKEFNALLAIYSSYNILKGHNYILKLKSVIKEQKNDIKRRNKAFNTINFLIDKINKLRDQSFYNFPQLEHCYSNYKNAPQNMLEQFTDNNAPYKWISFYRNGSYFMLPYSHNEIIPVEQIKKPATGLKNLIKIKHKENLYRVIDLFSTNNTIYNKSAKAFLIINNNPDFCYSVDKIDRLFFSKTNFMQNKIKNLNIRSGLAKGYVKIAGKRYIYLKS